MSVETAQRCLPQSLASQSLQAAELMPTPRRIDLKTLRQVRREMSNVYRDARSGRLESSEGTRLVYMLAQIGKMVELAELESRLARLEALNNGNY